MSDWVKRNALALIAVSGAAALTFANFIYIEDVVNPDAVCEFKINEAVDDIRWCVLFGGAAENCLQPKG